MRGCFAPFDCLPGCIYSLGISMGEGANSWLVHLLGNEPHCLKVTRRANGEAGLDNIHTEPFQLPGNLQLLLAIQHPPGRLLPIPKGGVEDDYFFHPIFPINIILKSKFRRKVL